MGKEKELEEMMRTGHRKRIEVVRAKQERTGILYSDARVLKCPEDVLRTFGSLFENAGVEQMLAVSLTRRGEPVAIQIIGIGGVDSCHVSVAEVMKLALLSNCSDILLLHNHPSGSVYPSKEDREMTERIKNAGELLEIHLLDHLIVGVSGEGYSIREEKAIRIMDRKMQKGA
jgi:DNA repair protein RadC